MSDIQIEILQNDDETHTLKVTGSPEDVAAITSFLVTSIQEVQEEFPEDQEPEGSGDLVS